MKIFSFPLAVCLLAGVGLSASAAETPAPAAAPAPAPETFKVERQKLAELVNLRLQSVVAKEANPRRIAEDMGLAWPVKAPAVSLRELRARAAADFKAELDAKFPATAAQFRQAAEEKYRLFQTGDTIELTLTGKRGTVTGILRTVQEPQQRVRVDDRWVTFSDLEDDSVAKLDAKRNKEMVEKQVSRDIRKNELEREDYASQHRAAAVEKALKAGGFTLVPAEKKGPPVWMSVKEVFDREVQKRVRAAEAAARPGLEAEIYGTAQYVKEGGEWIPKSVSETRRAAKEAAAARAAEEAAAKEKAAPAESPAATPPVTPAASEAEKLFNNAGK